MATVSQMQAFQTHLTERFTSFAMEVSQEVALIVKGYQEEIDCLRSLLNKEMNLRWNIALKDHNRLAVREQPPEPNVPEETVAEPIPKRYKIEHTQVWADVQEEKPTDVLHPVAKTTKEEQTEVLVSSAVGQSEAMAAMQQTGPSEPCAFERAGILAHNVSEPLANGPHEEHIEYNRNLALKQESGMDGGTAMDCPRSDPKEQDTPGLQTTTFDFYTAKEFTQPSTSGENTKQDLLHPERPMISLKKKGTQDDKPKRKTVMTTIALKKELIAKWERGTRVSDLAVQYKMAKSTVSTILKRKEAIKAADVAKGVKTLSSRRTDKVEEVEKVLLEWITHKQLRGDIVSETLICDKARELHNALTRDNPGGSAEEFKASKGWFVNFRERSGIRGVLRPREAARAEKGDIKRFEDEFQNIDIQRFLS
ncbi:uncharacterized protein LOC133162038 isoform X2 [Syngnathus typhle]|uniref:uncharacterized protein LOC133162038 isoform X2 n=1 Tax=Syngnathus typhle TaxID=161592 RepID=UPI002A6A1C01|nr:uncharacterized protein LOC133162038 isoform X2 [Syngnathus typhle]